jgi:hypothetical protein
MYNFNINSFGGELFVGSKKFLFKLYSDFGLEFGIAIGAEVFKIFIIDLSILLSFITDELLYILLYIILKKIIEMKLI